MIGDYLSDWSPQRADRATEATDRYLGRHPAWGESCDAIVSVQVIPRSERWRDERERRAQAMSAPNVKPKMRIVR